jgi:AbiV family abortive infection protein
MIEKKGSKTFMVLTQNDCIVAYRHVFDNADRLFKDAKILGENNSYGPATSLLIHSTEETMKGIILFMDGHGFKFRSKVNGINNLFLNHKLRYGLAMLLSLLHIFIEDLKIFVLKMQNEPDYFNVKEPDINAISRMIQHYVESRIILVLSEINWFSKAEFLRQDGFYVDFIDEIKTPLQITKNDYEDVLLRIEGLRDIVNDFVQCFESKDEKFFQIVEKLKDMLIDKKMYDEFSNLIELFRDKKNNPFNELTKVLLSFSADLNQNTILNTET